MQAILTSSNHASKLLRAWRQRDRTQITAELDNTAMFCRAAGAASAVELERCELLEAVAGEIGRLSPDRDSAAEADTYVRLLEHLSRG
jgi:hypothetical protein